MGRLAAPLILGLAGFLFVAPESVAQDAGGRVPVVTRLVKIFAGLEARLSESIARADSSSMDKLLQDDFEMRAGNAPGTPIPRQQWMDAVIAARGGAARAEQMAVHDYGTIAVVSFTQSSDGAKPVFVVDVWRSSGAGDWRLATRYAASSEAIAGARNVVPPATIPNKF
jgi:hypothetical protein